MADPNSHGQHVDEICWLQLDGVNLTSNGSTALTFDLPDGSTMKLTAVVANVSGSPVGLSAVQAPSWTGSQFSGSTGYYTIYQPNSAVLLGVGNNNTSVTLQNIRLFNPSGAEVTNPFELILADGESSNEGEMLDFGVASGGTSLQLVEWLGASAANNVTFGTPGVGGIPAAPASACSGFSSCVRLVGKSGTANAAVFATIRNGSPFSVVGQAHAVGGNQGFAFGLRWGGVKVRKLLPSGRMEPADQFTYSVLNVTGATMDAATTTGTQATAPYVTGQAVMPGNVLTLKEVMAAGSVSTLAQYDKTISCTNTITSSTVLPSGAYDPGTPPSIDLQNKGDNVACDIKNIPRIVDLKLVKTSPATVTAGSAFDYTLTISNNGTHDATNPTFSDTLPAGISGVAAADVTCGSATGTAVCGPLGVTISGQLVSGRIQSLPHGTSVKIMVHVTAPATTGAISNTATVSLATTDTTVGEPVAKRPDNSSTVTTQVVSPELTLAKTASASSFVVGTAASYTLQVTNTGTSATTAAATITDIVPAGLTVGTPPAGCAVSGQTVTCTVATGLAIGAQQSFVIPVTPAASVGATSVTNNASVAGGGDASCPAAAHCTAGVTTPVAGLPQLVLAKSHVGDFSVGVAGTYTLAVSNSGSAATSGTITVVDTLPTGLSFTSASGAGWTCSAAGQTVTCNSTAVIAAGTSGASITLSVAVSAAAVPNVTNTAHISGGGDGSCPAAGRCAPSDPTVVNGTASLTLHKTATVADTNGDSVTGDAGDVVTYGFSVTNTGDVALVNVAVTDPKLPTLDCSIASLAVGATTSCAATNNGYTITVVDVTAGSVINTASATGTPPGGITPPTGTDTVTTPTAATPVASFTLKKTASVADTNGDTVLGDAGDVVTYGFSVTNTGTVALTNVVVTDPKLPTLDCTIPDLAVGATASCVATNNSYTITAADVTAGSVTNTASATGTPPGTITPPTATDSVTTPTASTPVAGFSLKKTASVADTNGDTIIGDAGDVVTYSFSATNTGTVVLTNVTVTDPKLPTLDCTIPSLAVGATASCTATNNTYTITAADVTAGSIVNTASATGTPPGTITPPTGTDTVTTPTAATPVASFTLKKTAAVADTNGDTVLGDAGDVVTYGFSATNTGTVALTDVVVTDPKLPTLDCTIPSLAVGATASCAATNNTYTITAADVTAGSIVNTASATGTPPGTITPPTGTDTVTTPTAATPVASFTLKKTAAVADTNGDTVLGDAGDVVTYGFSATNTGTVALTDVVVTDPKLPTLDCTIPSLAVGATASCAATNNTYTITAADVTAGSIVNTASATGTPPGTITPPTGTDTVTTPTAATPVASFTLKKTAAVADTNGDTVLGDAGDIVTYGFSATNTGTVALTNVVVTDPKLPTLDCTIPSLAVGATASCAATNNTYTITAADVTAGSIVNTASATGTPPGTITPPTGTDTVTTPTAATPVASFTLKKTAAVADTNGDTVLGDAGDIVTYGFSATNTGTVALTNVVVTDPNLPALDCTIPSLAVGATASCTATNNSYTITAADVTAGSLTNTASATGTPPGTITPPTATDSVTTPTASTPVAGFSLKKTASVADANGDTIIGDAGDVVTYNFSVTNAGTVALTNVTVSDPRLPSLVCTIPSLATGATESCAATNNSYIVTAADVLAHQIINTATATGVPPGTITPPTATDTAVTPTEDTPVASFTLKKTAAVADTNGDTVLGDAGDVVTYGFSATNTGTVALTNVTVTDPKLPTLDCTIPSLAVGATASCAATNNTYTITAADVTAGTIVNTASATGTPPGTITPPTGTDTVTTPAAATPVASFTLKKSAAVADTNGDTVLGDAGDVVTYGFSATNTGTVVLTNVTVTDPKLPTLDCTIPSLAVGATASCAATNNTYTITAADVTAGTIVNTASATGTPPGTITPPTGTDTVTTPTAATPVASFTLKKSASVADSNGDTVLGDAGDIVTYGFSATNTGTVALTNVTVTDPKLPTLDCTIPSLAVGATASCAATNNTYTITTADVTAGSIVNTASATGTPPGTITPPTGTDTVATPTTATPKASFTLKKTATVADSNGDTVLGDAGDVITYGFSVANTGTVVLTNVKVTDPKLSTLDCTIPSLAVGATASCTATNNTYTITAADVTAGSIVNTASATGTPPGTITPPTGTDTVTTPTAATPVASFTLKKTAAVADSNGDTVLGDAGDVVTYGFSVTNTGTVGLTNVTVTDPKLPTLDCTIASLAVGATASCAATNNTYTITAADVTAGSIVNTASATGTPPGTITPPTGTDTVTTPTAATPVASFTLKKSASVADTNGDTVLGDAGDVVTYGFSATNTGTVALTNVTVTDPKLPTLDCTIPSLAVGATASCAATNNTYTITAADVTAGTIVNTASATGTPPGTITPPTGTDTVTTPTAATPVASFTLKKSASVADTNGDTVLGDAGDVVTYGFSATNTGTVALTNVTVTDPKLPTLDCTIPSLAVGATASCAATNNTYTITAADVTAGTIVNTASATGTPPGTITPPTGTDTVTTPAAATPKASFTLKKTATVADSNGDTVLGDAGDVITYGFSVTNTGTVVLTNVKVTDPKLPTLDCTIASLAVGATASCVATNDTYTITEDDNAAGSVINTASATGTPPGTITPPTGTDTVTTPTAAAPIASFTMKKTASVADTNGDTVVGDAGDQVTYAFSATNTGTVALTDVTVSDPKLPSLRCVIPSLALGATASCAPAGNVYTITAADVAAKTLVNTASASATGPGTVRPPNASATVTTPTVATPDGVLRLAKQASQASANIGDLVRYTVSIENTGVVATYAATLVDTPPTGFSYVDGSLQVVDADNAGSIGGTTPLRINGIDVPVGGHATVSYYLRVGAGTGNGVHTNRVVAVDATGKTISNQATADVDMAGDPLFDDSLLIGTVFDDRNGDGWQASATAAHVHVRGGFSPAAYVANSTTLDQGKGPHAVADHSSPMLDGIAVGSIGGRNSSADPIDRQQVVIHQLLSRPDFTDDFVLTTRDGTTLHMDASGHTTVERAGAVAKGMSTEDLAVERHISQTAEGLSVDYVIRNLGIDERGIPGVRVVSVEGLVTETDAYGRFNVQGIDGGSWARGRNFILKVDPSTLPPGSVFTTENPRVRRINPGVPVRFDFGVRLPPGDIGGGHGEARIELGEVLFEPKSAAIRAGYKPMLDAIADRVAGYHGGTLTVTAQAEQESLAFARANAVELALKSRLDPQVLAHTRIDVIAGQDDSDPLVSLDRSITLGSVLFDTDRATVKPAYRKLIEEIARTLETQHGGVVAIVGRADRRGSSAHNVQLGLDRAKAVYAAIAARLKPDTRQKVRVEISNDPDAPSGVGKR